MEETETKGRERANERKDGRTICWLAWRDPRLPRSTFGAMQRCRFKTNDRERRGEARKQLGSACDMKRDSFPAVHQNKTNCHKRRRKFTLANSFSHLLWNVMPDCTMQFNVRRPAALVKRDLTGKEDIGQQREIRPNLLYEFVHSPNFPTSISPFNLLCLVPESTSSSIIKPRVSPLSSFGR